MIEARWVSRGPAKASIYVSSHDGCNMGCTMCHLTTTSQTGMNHATPDWYYRQAFDVMTEAIKTRNPTELRSINVNFMARGDVFMNKHFRKDPLEVRRAVSMGVIDAIGMGVINIKTNISSIIPTNVVGLSLDDLIGPESIEYTDCWDGAMVSIPLSTAEMYYSLYTTNPAHRKMLLPNAASADTGLKMIAASTMPCKLHHAYIRGVNDDPEMIYNAIIKYGLVGPRVAHNVARFNPPLGSHLVEADEEMIKKCMEAAAKALGDGSSVKMIPRVGYDVNASYGMFEAQD